MIFDSLRELDTHIKTGLTYSVYLLYGPEFRQIESAREKMVRSLIPSEDSINLYRVDGSVPIDFDDIQDMLYSISFIGGSKCVVVDDLNLSLVKETELQKFADLLSTPLENAVLIITVKNSQEILQKPTGIMKKLLCLLEEKGALTFFPVMNRGDIGKFARNIAVKAGCILEPEESLYLVDVCNMDSLRLSHELEKVLAYKCYEGTITKEDIDKLISPTTDANVFKLGEFLLKKDLNGAISLVNDLLYLGEDPIAVLTLLSMSFCDFAHASAMRRNGISESTARKDFGYGQSFRFTKALESCGRMSPKALASVLDMLENADKRMKSAGADQRAILETILLEIITILRENA